VVRDEEHNSFSFKLERVSGMPSKHGHNRGEKRMLAETKPTWWFGIWTDYLVTAVSSFFKSPTKPAPTTSIDLRLPQDNFNNFEYVGDLYMGEN